MWCGKYPPAYHSVSESTVVVECTTGKFGSHVDLIDTGSIWEERIKSYDLSAYTTTGKFLHGKNDKRSPSVQWAG